jgi:hypothetical protein
VVASPRSIAPVGAQSYSRHMRRVICIIFVTGFCAFPAFAVSTFPVLPVNAGLFGLFGGSKQAPPGWMLRKQSVQIDKVDLKGADKPCGNWGWVAGIVDMASTRGAQIEQEYLVDRLYGGSVCLESAGDPGSLVRQISHEYVLPDGQKFQLAAHFTTGAPAQADPLIVSILQKKPLMLFWRKRAYLLTGMDYDEYIASSGNKMFIVTELRLFDPLGEEGKRQVTFSRDTDNPDDLNGVLEISIYPK